MFRAIGLPGAGAVRGPSDPEDTDEVEDGETRELFVVSPSGIPGDDALEEATAARAAFEITEERGLAPIDPGPEPGEFCKPAPKVREYVSSRDTSEGTLPAAAAPAAARCCAAAGPYRLR